MSDYRINIENIGVMDMSSINSMLGIVDTGDELVIASAHNDEIALDAIYSTLYENGFEVVGKLPGNNGRFDIIAHRK